jgi:hypothetical protein
MRAHFSILSIRLFTTSAYVFIFLNFLFSISNILYGSFTLIKNLHLSESKASVIYSFKYISIYVMYFMYVFINSSYLLFMYMLVISFTTIRLIIHHVIKRMEIYFLYHIHFALLSFVPRS